MSDMPTIPIPPDRDIITARPVTCAALPPAPAPLALASLSRRAAALDLLLVLLVTLLVPFGFELSALLVVPEGPDYPVQQIIIIRKWFDALLLIGMAGYLVHRHRLPSSDFGMQAARLGTQVLWALPTLCAIYAVFVCLMLVISAVVLTQPGLESDLARRSEFMRYLPLHDFAGTVLLLIAVALHEELLFRGLLLPYLHRLGCSWAVAILISSTVFALLHVTQGWLGVVQVFGVGAVLGLFFVLSRSLLTVVIAHFMFNLIQTQLVRVLLPWLEEFAQRVTPH